MSETKGTTEIADSGSIAATNGDGVGRSLPVPADRTDAIRAVIYGGSVSKAQVDHDYNNEPAFAELVKDQQDSQAEREGVAKLAPSGKAGVQEVETQQSRSPQDALEATNRMFVAGGALLPPYDPAELVHLFEHSNSLRQNVDAYVTNIDGYGHKFEPTINMESDDLNEQIKMAMFQDDVIAGVTKPTMPTEAQVEAKVKEITQEMAVEKIKLEFFFQNSVNNESFVTHRSKTRQDQEIAGNAYWEVLRDTEGNIAQFMLVSAHTVRLMPQGPELVSVEQNVQATAITFTKRVSRRRFRTFVQVFGGIRVYFKEFTDPRIISALSGRAWDSIEAMRKEEGPQAREANELLHFSIYNTRSPYGVPRWIGALLAVLGSRQAEEVNFLYFDNKSIPPLVMMVQGGRVSDKTVKKIEDFIENDIKHRKNFHKILVLEAEPATTAAGPEHTGRMKIELKPLTQAIHNDALFQGYDKENIHKVGQSFRLPPLLRGDSRDFNRATALAVLKFTEQQIFAPERNKFDDMMNRLVLADLGICYFRFKSMSPKTTDPEDAAKVVERLAKIGALVPRDIRTLAEDILNTDLKRIDEPWMDIPLPLATSGRIAELLEGPGDLFDPGSGTSTKTPLGGGKPGTGEDEAAAKSILASITGGAGALGAAQDTKLQRVPSPAAAAKSASDLIRVRDTLKRAELAAREQEVAKAEFAQLKDEVEPNGEPTIIEVPRADWDRFGLVPDDEG